jgi:hypothetical protein
MRLPLSSIHVSRIVAMSCLALETRPTYFIELGTVRGSNCPAPSWSRTVDSRNEEPRDGGAAFLFRLQINVTNHAAVVPLTAAATVCNLLPQIWQPDVGPVALNQSLLSILTRAPAFRGTTGELSRPG